MGLSIHLYLYFGIKLQADGQTMDKEEWTADMTGF